MIIIKIMKILWTQQRIIKNENLKICLKHMKIIKQKNETKSKDNQTKSWKCTNAIKDDYDNHKNPCENQTNHENIENLYDNNLNT